MSGGFDKKLFSDINLCINSGDKIVIVGKNGVGKSTLMQYRYGNLPTLMLPNFEGEIIKNPKMKIGYYNQHLADILPLDKTPINFMLNFNNQIDEFQSRKCLGSMGLEGKIHSQILSTLSGGQKARVVLASIKSTKPQLLILDEPTNHLDMESIDELISEINNFKGSIIMITHNIDIIEKTNSKILKLENLQLTEINFDDYYDEVLDEIDKY